MSKDLPPKPCLANLKKQAKALLASHRQGELQALQTVSLFLPRVALAREGFGLRQAQYVIAREYGYANWECLKVMVDVKRGVATVVESLPLERRGHGARFTQTVKKVMQSARAEAFRLGCSLIAPEHLLLGILKEAGSSAMAALQGLAAGDLSSAVESLETRGDRARHGNLGELVFESAAKSALEVAAGLAKEQGADLVETCHLLMALVKPSETAVAVLLRQHGIEAAALEQTAVLGRQM